MLLTVIIPVYNGADTIGRTIDSIPAREDVEIIVVDDGSSDGSADVASRSGRVRLIKHPKNRGVGSAVNTGIAKARGNTSP